MEWIRAISTELLNIIGGVVLIDIYAIVERCKGCDWKTAYERACSAYTLRGITLANYNAVLSRDQNEGFDDGMGRS